MKVIKRNGTEVEFDATKIAGAITRAGKDRIPFDDIAKITDSVGDQCALLGRAPHVEEIQDMVEDALMENGYATVARDYIRYRYGHGYNESDEYRERLRADGVDNKVVVENSAVEQNICYARAEQKRFFADLARQDIDERIGHYADAY